MSYVCIRVCIYILCLCLTLIIWHNFVLQRNPWWLYKKKENPHSEEISWSEFDVPWMWNMASDGTKTNFVRNPAVYFKQNRYNNIFNIYFILFFFFFLAVCNHRKNPMFCSDCFACLMNHLLKIFKNIIVMTCWGTTIKSFLSSLSL